MNKMVRRLLAAVAMTCAMSAQAAVTYTGSWDPPFGQPLDKLGWRGSYELDFNCAGAVAASCGTFSKLSVVLYYHDPGSANDGSVINTLDFASSKGPTLTSLAINKDGDPYKWVSGWSDWVATSGDSALLRAALGISDSNPNKLPYFFSVIFDNGFAKLCYDPPAGHNSNEVRPASCPNGQISDPNNLPAVSVYTADGRLVTASGTPNNVPEPGTLALVGAGALLAALRRRSVFAAR